MPRATSTVPEFTVRGNTVMIIPPPEAIPTALGTSPENCALALTRMSSVKALIAALDGPRI